MTTEKSKRMNPMIITDPDENREYTLEFSRKTAAKAEQAGLDISKVDSAPMTMIPLLFWGAFLMHHPHMSKDQTDKILFDGLGGMSDQELEYIGKLYAEAFKTLVVTEDEGANPRKMAVKF